MTLYRNYCSFTAIEIIFWAKLVFLQFFTGSTVFIPGAAKPSCIGATSSGADCTFTILFDNSLGGSHGNQFFGNISFLAVFFTGSAVLITGTAEPSSIGATSSGTN